MTGAISAWQGLPMEVKRVASARIPMECGIPNTVEAAIRPRAMKRARGGESMSNEVRVSSLVRCRV
jgi:hypothetical protein